MSEALRYRVTPAKPHAHLFEVQVIVPRPATDGQAFAIPAWVPGSYKIRDMSRNVVSIGAKTGDIDIELTKLDKSTWRAAPCEGPLTLTLEFHAYELNVRGTYLDGTRGFFDGACLFPRVIGQENNECLIDFIAPTHKAGAQWRLATSMEAVDAGPYEFGQYRAADYEELIDHPVEMGEFQIGEFEAGGIPHAIVVRGHTKFDMARVCHDLTRICEAQLEFFGKPKDLDRYLFLLAVRDSGYGGLEHRWSSALMCSREDLPARGDSRVTDDYRKFLGLCSHEYFHLWNVKRIKPATFVPYDLRAEQHTGLLWVFEGCTSYYDDLFLVRSGVISVDDYLEMLGKAITRVLRTWGRHRQTIEESSFDAWTKLYQADANASNSMISYYAKGALVALALDLTIRKESGGEFSLDDVMIECWHRFGESDAGMPERGIETVAREVTGLELIDFFERYVRGTVDPPLQPLLRFVGVNLHQRAATSSRDSGGKPARKNVSVPPYLGAALESTNGKYLFAVVHSNSPAEKAGLAPGDEAIAIDNMRLTSRNLDERLREHHVGDRVLLTVFRDHRLMRLKVRLGKPPEETCYLDLDDDVSVETEGIRKAWLGIA